MSGVDPRARGVPLHVVGSAGYPGSSPRAGEAGVWDRARRCSDSGRTLNPVILNRRNLFSLGLASFTAWFHAVITPLFGVNYFCRSCCLI